MNEWADSLEKTAVNDMNEWLKNFATEEQKRAVKFGKGIIDSQYKKFVMLVESKPYASVYSRMMLKVLGIRLKKLDGLKLDELIRML